MAIELMEEETGEPFCTLTVNVPHANLAANEILVKTWTENAPVREPALGSGLFTDTGRRISTGYAEAEVWTLSDAIVKQFQQEAVNGVGSVPMPYTDDWVRVMNSERRFDEVAALTNADQAVL